MRSDGQKSNDGRESRRGSGGGGRGKTAVTATGTAKTGLVDGGGGEKEATAWCGSGRCSSHCSRCHVTSKRCLDDDSCDDTRLVR